MKYKIDYPFQDWTTSVLRGLILALITKHINATMTDSEDICSHIQKIQVHPPNSKGCQECLKLGSEWVHLRLCLACGQVGCCDDSPNKHASKHAKSENHPVLQTFEPEDKWLYCFIDDVLAFDPPAYYDGDRTTFRI